MIPAEKLAPWQAYAYTSRLPSGGATSIGSSHSATVTSTQRDDGTRSRSDHHAHASSPVPTSHNPMISGPFGPCQMLTGVGRNSPSGRAPPRNAATASSTEPARPIQRERW